MRTSVLFTLAAALAAETICASDHDCYPKVFVPTNDWQEIRPGQDIPPGLHVRLNVDTLKREAKLMADDDSGDVNAVYVNPDHQEQVAIYKPQLHENIDSWQAAVDEILGGGTRLEPALDIVADLSHDLEHGAKLTHNPEIFPRLLVLAKEHPDLQDSIYRIMASSLRNNPDAVQQALDSPHNDATVSELLRQLPSSDDTLQKRILGVVSPLTTPSQLMEYYPYLGPEARSRLFNILEDDSAKRDQGQAPDEQVSVYLQKRVPLVPKDKFDNYLDALIDLHKNNEDLNANDEFLTWLADEVEKTKGASPEMHKRLLDARHNVFGNPMAMRKALADEL
ncbi:hypothetical protein DIURU_002709 [Diutina rugosa]|uniref:Nucleotide exchange factor SIL1 n=1 Tax=Diutina rugosa TaxID=5481 RepID=A0A642UP34_DIURU|nr:uncharacterized protein DIURU_002709 [Diutina rugosa]KAA8902813.1 hypothetical protein DIURU_002709 [Diutina rugosa]